MKNRRFKCDEKFDFFLNEQNDEAKRLESTLSPNKSISNDSKIAQAKHKESVIDNSFINLTNRETFNNLIGTYR